MKAVLICSVIIKTVFAVCVVAASMYFKNPRILWWFILLPFLGWEYHGKQTGEEGTTNENH